MSLDPNDVAHVATLARIGLSAGEQAHLGAQLGAIIEHVSQLNGVDTSSVPETAQVGAQLNAWREDVSRPSLPPEVALGQAPSREGGYFRVGAIQE